MSLHMQSLKPLTLLPPAARVASVDGTGVDLQQYAATGDINLKATMDVGTVTGTNPTWDAKIQESDSSGSGYADITGAAFTQVTATGTGAVELHFRTVKRYVRVSTTIGGTGSVTGATGIVDAAEGGSGALRYVTFTLSNPAYVRVRVNGGATTARFQNGHTVLSAGFGVGHALGVC